MMEWFKAGGFGMFVILLLGAGGIGYGIKALLSPTKGRAATLRSFPALIISAAVFGFGTNLWAVYGYLIREAEKTAGDQAIVAGMIGFTEAAQALTLGGVLALIVSCLKVAVDGKLGQSNAD